MGEQRRLTKRIERLEQQVQQLAGKVQAVAESAGSALAVEALSELVGQKKVGQKMTEVMKRKQAEAEEAMAKQVTEALEKGFLQPAEAVGERSLVVGLRKEGEVEYRVDLVTPRMTEPERALYRGKKVGETVEQGPATVTILEVYDFVQPAPAAAPTEVVPQPEAATPEPQPAKEG